MNWPVGLGGKGNEGVTGLVKQTPGSIGYVELAYAVQNKLAYAEVKNKAGKFITPSVESTTAAAAGAAARGQEGHRRPIVNSANAKAYPIAGFTYLLVYKDMKDPAKGKALAGFLKWAMADGQKMASPLLLRAAAREVVAINNATLKTLTAGGQKFVAK